MTKKRSPPSALPVAEAYYSVTQLPAVTAPSPNPALRTSEGMVRAVFAVWYTSIRPDIAALEPPDELGCFIGANCAVEAQTAADRCIRQRKGPRSFAFPLPDTYAQAVYRDGLRQRTTALTLGGREALTELGLRHDDKTLTDTTVRSAYGKLIATGKKHPDQGGSKEEFERITRVRDIAIEYVRAMGEAHGHAGQSNEERDLKLTKDGRELLRTWAAEQREKGDVETNPHHMTGLNATMTSILKVLVKRGLANYGQKTVHQERFVLTKDGLAYAAELDKRAEKRATKKRPT